MITKIIALFLLAMAMLAMFGKLRFPGVGRKRTAAKVNAQKCPECGTYRIGRGACACKAPPDNRG